MRQKKSWRQHDQINSQAAVVGAAVVARAARHTTIDRELVTRLLEDPMLSIQDAVRALCPEDTDYFIAVALVEYRRLRNMSYYQLRAKRPNLAQLITGDLK